MSESIADLARRLALNAEAVCRHYLSNGRRQERYWIAGDLDNNAGEPLCPTAWSRQGRRRKWTNAATGEDGDLLDLIAGARRLGTLREVIAEARRFLGLSRPPQ